MCSRILSLRPAQRLSRACAVPCVRAHLDVSINLPSLAEHKRPGPAFDRVASPNHPPFTVANSHMTDGHHDLDWCSRRNRRSRSGRSGPWRGLACLWRPAHRRSWCRTGPAHRSEGQVRLDAYIYELQLSRAQSSTVHVHDGRTILLTHADKDGHFVFELGDNLTSRCEWSLHCISAARHVLSGCPV